MALSREMTQIMTCSSIGNTSSNQIQTTGQSVLLIQELVVFEVVNVMGRTPEAVNITGPDNVHLLGSKLPHTHSKNNSSIDEPDQASEVHTAQTVCVRSPLEAPTRPQTASLTTDRTSSITYSKLVHLQTVPVTRQPGSFLTHYAHSTS